MLDHSFVHELQAVTGFGDRILDVWAVLTISRLIEPSANTLIKWDDGPDRQVNQRILGTTYEQSLKRNYSTKLFEIPGCRFVDTLPSQTVPVLKNFAQDSLNEQGVVTLPDGTRQIILISGAYPGSSSPKILHQQLSLYGLDSSIRKEKVVQLFRDIAKSTKCSREIEAAIPQDAHERVGIHVRLTDKLVSDEVSWEMTPREWSLIERLGMSAIRKFIASGTPMMICSDDPVYRQGLVNWIRSRGGDVVSVEEPAGDDKHNGCAALSDFFALSRAKSIVQLTKFSTFSIGSALVGDIPFTNFRLKNSKKENLIESWKSAFRVFNYAEDELGEWTCLRDRALTMIARNSGVDIRAAKS